MQKYLFTGAFLLGLSVVAHAQTCPPTLFPDPPNNYWIVQDTNPDTQVFNGATGAFVTLPDATYTTWTAAGCTASSIGSAVGLFAYMHSVADQNYYSHGLGTTYSLVTLTADTALSAFNAITDVSPNADGWKLKLMNARLFTSPPIGALLRFASTNSHSFIVTDTGGNQLINVQPGTYAEVTLTNNSTVNGTWRVNAVHTSVANAFATPSIGLPSSTGDILIPSLSSGSNYTWLALAMSGDCTISSGSITCTKTGGTSFGPFATATGITGLVLGNGASAPSAYGGTSCTNQFPRSLNASGAATCASVANADLAADVFSTAHTWSAAQTINLNSGSAPTAISQTILQLVAGDSQTGRILLDSAAGQSVIQVRRANNTMASPSALAINDLIGSFSARGYGSTGYASAGRAVITLNASEAWTDSAQGTYITFQTTPTGGTSTAEVARFAPSGALLVGTTTDAAAGVVNVLTGYRIGNAAASGAYLRGNGTNFVSGTLSLADASMTSLRIIGRTAIGSGSPQELTASQGINLAGAGLTADFGSTADIWAGTQYKVVGADILNSSQNLTALTDASTVTVDMSLGINYSLLMTAGVGATRALGNPSNTQAGRSGCIIITQSSGGSNALTYSGNWKFSGGTAPTLSTAANAVDMLCYVVQDSTHIFATLTKDMR